MSLLLLVSACPSGSDPAPVNFSQFGFYPQPTPPPLPFDKITKHNFGCVCLSVSVFFFLSEFGIIFEGGLENTNNVSTCIIDIFNSLSFVGFNVLNYLTWVGLLTKKGIQKMSFLNSLHFVRKLPLYGKNVMTKLDLCGFKCILGVSLLSLWWSVFSL